ncbi:DUF2752 domain-containing protein [Brachybacterium sp. YJGR34]|uniref:DUF2752 domain-containing protein n=1 Tax=Brachybacterium sp. YJGR34 TaxID=2059911 RepID=UPI000E0A4827|nr:DUF2752 domain-containing protein [Brachybacterium sp. YJGR34]
MTTAARAPRGEAAADTPAGGLRRVLLPLAVLAGGAALALGVQAVFDPFRTHIPLCIVHELTGLECPGCGAIRSVHALLAGDPLLALRSNALVITALPLLALGMVLWAVRRARGQFAGLRPSTRTLLVLIAIIVLYTVLRNLPAFWFLAPISYVGA